MTSTCMKDSVTSSASFSLWIKKVEDLARFDLAWPGPLGTFSSFSIHLLSLVSTDFRCFDSIYIYTYDQACKLIKMFGQNTSCIPRGWSGSFVIRQDLRPLYKPTQGIQSNP